MKNGIDISYYQKKVEYEKLKEQGIDFVIIRLGYGKNKSQRDKCFEKHYKGCKQSGLKVGAYLYSYAKSMKDVDAEIENALNIIKDKKFDLPIFYDLEEKEQDKKIDLFKASEKWINEIQKAGYTAGIYVNLDWYKRYFSKNNLSSNYLWLAQWNNNEKPDIPCRIWQHSNKGKIEGIEGNVDLDRLLIEQTPEKENLIQKPIKKSNYEIAQEVIKGFWSVGLQRKILLEQAGYNYSEIQNIVNKLLTKIPATYNIKKGDTLSAIAKKYNTTVTHLARLNNIKNPNFIKAGDTIKLK